MLHPIVLQLSPSAEQLPAIIARDVDVAVTAGAGTGKTRTLVARYLSLLADGVPLRQIIAITFTEKAAREMRNRVRVELERFLQAEPDDRARWLTYQRQLDAARINTIHSLCAEILRNHPAEAGIDPRFEILDEGRGNILREQAIVRALAWAAEDVDAARLFPLFGERGLAETLDKLIMERVKLLTVWDSLPSDLVAHWEAVIDARKVAAVQEMRESADFNAALQTLQSMEPRDPRDKLALQRETVLSSAIALPTSIHLTPQQWRAACACLDELNLRVGSKKAWPDDDKKVVTDALSSLREIWRAAKLLLSAELTDHDRIIAAALPHLRIVLQRTLNWYERAKRQRTALDFDDLEQRALELLRDNVAVRQRWQNEIASLLVDEFQDTNGRQRDIVQMLNGGQKRLFIVGDAKQSIYRFRGAEVQVFQQERLKISGAGGTVQVLSQSYRSHERLLIGMNGFFRPILGLTRRHPFHEPFAPLTHFHPLSQKQLTAPNIEMHLTVGNKAEGALERAADALATRLIDIVENPANGITYEDIAILCRASASFRAYEDALDRAGVPFVTIAGRGFYERPEIRDLLNALAAIADPHDDLALAGFLRSPVIGFTDEKLLEVVKPNAKPSAPAGSGGILTWGNSDEFPDDFRVEYVTNDDHLGGPPNFQEQNAADATSAAPKPEPNALWQQLKTQDDPDSRYAVNLLTDLNTLAGRVSVADLLHEFLTRTDYRAAMLKAEQPRAARNVSKLLRDAHDSGIVRVQEFLDYTNNLRERGGREGEARAVAEGVITIMSVHQAKGLEYPVVVIGDAGYGGRSRNDIILDDALGVLFPLKDAEGNLGTVYELGKRVESEKDSAESDRLFYVAATRAKDKLILSGTIMLKQDGKPGWLGGWLKSLNEPLAFGRQRIDGYDEEGGRGIPLTLYAEDEGDEERVNCVVYEPNFRPKRAREAVAVVEGESAEWTPNLLQSLITEQPEEDRQPSKVWRVVPAVTSKYAPAWVIGSLFHDAVAAWKFADLDDWLAAHARGYGLTDATQITNAVKRTTQLLTRLHEHRLYRVLSNAVPRHHELPYSYLIHDELERGKIDLLFLHNDRWEILDFKTDRLRNNGDAARVANEKGYLDQAQRYQAAVTTMLGTTPRAHLVFMDDQSKISLLAVKPN